MRFYVLPCSCNLSRPRDIGRGAVTSVAAHLRHSDGAGVCVMRCARRQVELLFVASALHMPNVCGRTYFINLNLCYQHAQTVARGLCANRKRRRRRNAGGASAKHTSNEENPQRVCVVFFVHLNF